MKESVGRPVFKVATTIFGIGHVLLDTTLKLWEEAEVQTIKRIGFEHHVDGVKVWESDGSKLDSQLYKEAYRRALTAHIQGEVVNKVKSLRGHRRVDPETLKPI